mgnify:CR=1 FL=1
MVFEGWRDGRLARAIDEADLVYPRKLERHALQFLAGTRKSPTRLH